MKISKIINQNKRAIAVALFSWMVAGQSVGLAQTAISLPQNAVPPVTQTAVVNPSAGTGIAVQSQQMAISGLVGEVRVLTAPDDAGRPAQNGEMLAPGLWIKVGDPGAAEISFESGTKIYLSAGALFRVETAAKDTRQKTLETILRLDLGKLKAEVAKQGDSPFQIKTPTAVASVRGTVLYLSVNQIAANLASTMTDLFVDEGAVDFGALDNAVNSILVREFGSSSIAGDGTVLPERRLSREERDSFVESFDQAFVNIVAGNPQFAVEGTPIPPPPPQNNPNAPNGGLNAFVRDFVANQNTEGSASRSAANRLLIAGLLVNTLLDRLVAGAEFSDIEDRRDDGALLSEGALGVGLDEWDFGIANEVADAGIVSSDRLADLDILDQTKGDADSSLDVIDESVITLKGLFVSATASPNNAGFVPPALAAADDADDEREAIEDQNDASDAAFKRLEVLRQSERDLLKNELESLLDGQEERVRQAQIERTFDAQTGKVFTDIHGNRVRTDQYIDQPDADRVRVTALTYRAAGDLAGITSMVWEARFNTAIEGLLRDLPWNDYLNVVSHEQMDEFLANQGEGYFYPNGGECEVDCGEYGSDHGSYIVHESSGPEEPTLYPTEFKAAFKNPAGDRVVFEETYGAPEQYVFGVSEGDSFWAQQQDSNRTAVYLADSEYPVAERVDGDGDYLYSDDGSQSEIVDLDGFNPVDPVDHPAYFVDEMYLTEDGEEFLDWENSYYLVGQLIPFDNDGQILSAPGFRLRGIRDLIRPQTVVNDGKYNLEVILQFGTDGYDDETGTDYFEPLFTIDAIVTPEIFGPYGVANTSSRFPDSLQEDDEEYYYE